MFTFSLHRERSGNPGYILGRPVLFGYAVNASTVAELVSGYTVPSAIAPYDSSYPETFGRSVCPQQLSYSNDTAQLQRAAGRSQVQFGYDSTSGCSVQLTRAQLLELCCAGSGSCSGDTGVTYTSTYSKPATGIPYFFEFTNGWVREVVRRHHVTLQMRITCLFYISPQSSQR